MLQDTTISILKVHWHTGGGKDQLVSRLPLKLRTWVWIPVGDWLGSPNAWMRREEITNCKSHIASVSLTDWCIMIFKKCLKKDIYILIRQTILASFVHVFNTIIVVRDNSEKHYLGDGWFQISHRPNQGVSYAWDMGDYVGHMSGIQEIRWLCWSNVWDKEIGSLCWSYVWGTGDRVIMLVICMGYRT